MKIKSLLLLSVLVGIINFTSVAYGNSSLRLTIEGRGVFAVYVDDMCISGFQNDFTFNGLGQGRHHLVILKPEGNQCYKRGVRMHVLYDGYVRLMNHTTTLAYFNRNKGLRVFDEGIVCCSPLIVGCSHVPAPAPMGQVRFDELCRVIDSRVFESARLEVAQNAIRDNLFDTEQVEQLLSLFVFESSKLAIAKCAYRQTIDRENYYRLFDDFAFDSSVRELDDFISHG